MAAANGNTFDLVPPVRPSLDQSGGVGMVDDVENPPNPTTMPNAAQLNTHSAMTAAYGAVVPHTVISVHFVAGVPGISAVSSARTGTTSGLFTVTDMGNGDTKVEWPVGTFPAPVAGPTGSLNTAGSWLAPVFAAIANGIRVTTKDNTNTAADCDWTAEIR